MALNDPENPEKARRAQDVEESPRILSSSEFHGGRGVCILAHPNLGEGEGHVTGVYDCRDSQPVVSKLKTITILCWTRLLDVVSQRPRYLDP